MSHTPKRPFAKAATTFAEQMALLQRRGMVIQDAAEAEHHLRHINYYRLRAYWMPFEVPCAAAGDHQFAGGTQFEDVVRLYAFDRKLRLMVLDAIERFEVSLRTQWSHVLATQLGPHAHMDPNNFRDPVVYQTALADLQREFHESRETFAQHYRKTYDAPDLPPVWVSCELLTLGRLSRWYSNLASRPIRRAISQPLGIDENILTHAAHHLSYVRNLCAHHSRLWNRVAGIALVLPNRPIDLTLTLNAQEPKKVYNTLVVLLWLLKHISPGSVWRQGVRQLLADNAHVNLTAMGFPQGWETRPLWQKP